MQRQDYLPSWDLYGACANVIVLYVDEIHLESSCNLHSKMTQFLTWNFSFKFSNKIILVLLSDNVLPPTLPLLALQSD